MAEIRSEWWNGGLVGRDGFCRTPNIEAAMARKCYGRFEHFAPGLITSTTTYPGFTVSQITAGTLTMADVAGGWLLIGGGGGDGQGIQMQSDGACFVPAAGKHLWLEVSAKLTDADDNDWFIGLAVTDTNVFSTDPTDLIAFRGDDGDANIDFQVRGSSTGASADTGTDMADATAIRLGFQVYGVTHVTPYINGVAQTAVTANIPTAALRLTFGSLRGATTATNPLALDWYRILQLA